MSKKYLPLSSLMWDCWNVSIMNRVRQMPEYTQNQRNVSFKKYLDGNMDNYLHIAEEDKVELSDVICIISEVWTEAIKKEYNNMHVNNERFDKFVKKYK